MTVLSIFSRKENDVIIILTGASHTGKTVLSQKMLEKFHYPYLSIDHLKMGLIRSGHTSLTPEDDDELTDYLWPVVREMIKTAIENEQNMIVEGCYVPFDFRKDFDEEYLSSIRFICLAMTDEYIDEHYEDIKAHESDVETRFVDDGVTALRYKEMNREFIDGFTKAGEKITLIDGDYEKTIDEVIKSIE